MNALDELKAAVKGDRKLEGLVKRVEQMYIDTGKKLAKERSKVKCQNQSMNGK